MLLLKFPRERYAKICWQTKSKLNFKKCPYALDVHADAEVQDILGKEIIRVGLVFLRAQG